VTGISVPGVAFAGISVAGSEFGGGIAVSWLRPPEDSRRGEGEGMTIRLAAVEYGSGPVLAIMHGLFG